MSTKSIKIDLPSTEQITAGLSLSESHPPLAEAERAVVTAEARLAEAQEEHANEEARLTDMRAAGVGVDVLADALLRPEAARMIVEQYEEDLATARERVDQEKTGAQRAYGDDLGKRVARLQDLADQLSPALRELRDLWIALERHAARGFYTPAVAWPTSPNERHRVSSWQTD